MLTIADICAESQVSPDTVRAWITRGELPAIDVSRDKKQRRRYRVERKDWEAFKQRSRVRPAAAVRAKDYPVFV